jgi:hypothetical protein
MPGIDGESASEAPPQAPATVAGFISRAAGHVADALRYWEPRRIIYNVALALVVAGHVIAGWPGSRAALSTNVLLGLFFLAVLANICYCGVYVIDLFVQFSGLRSFWVKGRVMVLVVGTAFAAVIAHFFATNIFSNGS